MHFKLKKNIKKIVLLAVIFISAFFIVRGIFVLNSNKKVIEDKSEIKNTEKGSTSGDQITEKFEAGYFAPILAFHNVTDSLKKDPYGLTVNTLVFEKKLQDINEHKYNTLFVSEVAAYLAKGENIPKDAVALTFDDGKENFYTNVFPLLKKYNIKASLYIITGVRSVHYLSESQIKEIDQSGLVEIGSHTVYHQRMSKLPEERQLKELKDSKKYLEKLLGKEITVICYPYGDHSDLTKQLSKQVGYKYGLNFDKVPVVDSADMFEIDRVGVFPELNISKYLEKLNIKNHNI